MTLDNPEPRCPGGKKLPILPISTIKPDNQSLIQNIGQ